MTKPLPPATGIVLFDVEGSLVDCIPQTLQCWREVLARYGFEVPLAQLQRYSGMDTTDLLAELLPATLRPRATEIADAEAKHYREKYLASVCAFPGVRQLFEKLKQSGCRIGLATSCQPDELAVYLELTQIRDVIDAAACGADAKKGKPHPDLQETSDAAWFDPADVAALPVEPGARLLIVHALSGADEPHLG